MGDNGPPWGTPFRVLSRRPSTITPARRYLPISFRTRLSCTFLLTMAGSQACFHARGFPVVTELQAGQASPDKDVIYRYTTAAFTVSSKPGALSCCANLPGDSALYAISVRWPIILYSRLLRTSPRGIALAFD